MVCNLIDQEEGCASYRYSLSFSVMDKLHVTFVLTGQEEGGDSYRYSLRVSVWNAQTVVLFSQQHVCVKISKSKLFCLVLFYSGIHFQEGLVNSVL